MQTLRPSRERNISDFAKVGLEVIFLQSKRPLEKALGIAECSSLPPSVGPHPKECLQDWLERHGAGQAPDAQFKQRVAAVLDVSSDSDLGEIVAWRQLLEGLQAYVSPHIA